MKKCLSQQFIAALNNSEERQYILAQKVNMSPSLLAQYKRKIVTPRVDDDRIIKLGHYLGLNDEEIFE